MLIQKIATKRGFGDAEGPFGFPLPSETCKLIDTLLKSVSKECKEAATTIVNGQPIQGLVRSVTIDSEFKFEKDERTDVSMITTFSVDRDFEVVDPNGIDRSSYQKNPIVGYGHNYKELPIGRSQWTKRVTGDSPERDGILAKTEYTKRPDSWPTQEKWVPDAVFHFVQEGVLKGKSIGFVALEGRQPEKKDIDKRADLAKARFIFTKSLLIEYSVVGAQSNPNALLLAVSRAKGLGIEVPEFLLKEDGLEIGSAMDDLIDVTPALPSLKGCMTDEEVRKQVRSVFTGLNVEKIASEQLGLLSGKV